MRRSYLSPRRRCQRAAAGSFAGVHLPKINPSGPRIDVDMSGCVVTRGWSFFGGGGRHVSVISGADLKKRLSPEQGKKEG